MSPSPPRPFRRLRAFEGLWPHARAFADVLISMVPQLAGLACGLAASVLVARGLGPHGLGQFTLAMSLGTLITGFSDLGSGHAVLRFAPRASHQGDRTREAAMLRWAFQTRLALAAALCLAGFALAPWIASSLWHAPELATPTRWCLLLAPISVIAAIPNLLFQSRKQFGLSALALSTQRVASLAGILLIGALGIWTVSSVALATVLAALAGALGSLCLMPESILVSLSLRSQGGWQAFWKFPAPCDGDLDRADNTDTFARSVMISGVAVQLTIQSELWLVGALLPKESLGVYHACGRVALPLTMLTAALSTALWPRASVSDLKTACALLRRVSKLSLVLMLPALGYAVAAPKAIPVLFGPQFADGVFLGQVLSLHACLLLFLTPMGVVAYRLGLAPVYSLMNSLQLLGSIILNVLLLPRCGILGAALTTLVNGFLALAFGGFAIWNAVRRSEEYPA